MNPPDLNFCGGGGGGGNRADLQRGLTIALSATVLGSGGEALQRGRRECVCGCVVFGDMCSGMQVCVCACECVQSREDVIDVSRGQITKGFAGIQYIMKGLYVESNMPQFSGSSWRSEPWERSANELINGTSATFTSQHLCSLNSHLYLCGTGLSALSLKSHLSREGFTLLNKF